MLTRLADLGIRVPKRILGFAAFVLIAGAVFGVPVADHLSAGGFADPGASSTAANDLLAGRFHAGDPNLVLQVSAPGGADDAAARAEGERLVGALRGEPDARQAESYWTAPAPVAPGLRADDARSGLVVATVTGDDDQAPKRAAAIVDRLLADPVPGATVTAGGQAIAYHQVSDRVTADLTTAELVAVPLTGLVLIWVFGSVVAALVPLAVGLFSIAGTLALLRGLTAVTPVSVYAMNLTTALGLALAIDYSLFIVSRYREEARSGLAPADAVRVAMRTAGRTVLFSALTVGLSLAALAVFPVYFLRSFAYAGIGVVALAALASLVVVPALLTVLGPRLDALDIRVPIRRWLRRPPPRPVPAERSFWYRVASAVMRRAVPAGLAVTALLLVLGSPFLGVRFGYPDDRVLPPVSSSHQVGDALRTGFASNAAATITVVLPEVSGEPGALDRYATALSRIGGVTGVSSATGTYAAGGQVAPPSGAPMVSGASAYLAVRTGLDPMSDEGKKVLEAVKAAPSPGEALFTGLAAENEDSVAALGDRLPLAIALIAATTFVVLFLLTGSILLPLKALVLNTLSLSATFGAMVWIFQDGHLSSLHGSTVTGYLVATMPLLMFCLSFGISMDYEVFLLARIREHWLESGRTPADNERAVSLGLGHTGRIVTAAAVLMAIVFAALATGSVSFMQMFGTGLTLAVLMDATLVRGVLVPAFMRLAGRANWWAPGPLARWHARYGWTESGRIGESGPAKAASVADTG
ncbi:MMPL family transporter [Amycolatopsis minnesotensis]|uniref:MMPL family transporter n=1 Tax=Amycolatopsis minnesotensis TaxID=337894 RepID=A0ABP5BWJ4_9PSEU